MNDEINIQHWEHIDIRVLFEHPRFTILEEDVILPSGQVIQWWRFGDFPDAVCAICIDGQQRVLVSYQYNPAPRCIVPEFPGGAIRPNESRVNALRRELLEETGLCAYKVIEMGSFLVNNRHSSGRCYVYYVGETEGGLTDWDDEEIIQTEWIELSVFEQAIVEGRFDNGTMLAAWSIFRAWEKALNGA